MTKKAEAKTRCARPSDEPALRALYQTVFGDDDASADLFFSTWYEPGLTVVADGGGVPVSAAYILPAGQLALPGGARPGCAMLYAIGTHPDYRGHGLGAAVTRAAAALAKSSGFPAVVLKPAEDSLFDFYAGCGFQPFFHAAETECQAIEPARNCTRYALRPVAPSEYRRLRSGLLDAACMGGGAYIDMTERSLGYQQRLSEHSGGGLYAFEESGGACGCAAVELAGGQVCVKELLLAADGTIDAAMAAAAALYPSGPYMFRTLCSSPDRSLPCRPFGMLMPFPGCPASVQTVAWYGLAFD